MTSNGTPQRTLHHQQPLPSPATRRRGFTLVELLLVVTVIAILISLLLPSLGRAKEHSRRALCASQLRQIYQASVGYALEWKRRFPPRPLAFSHYHVGNFDPPSNKDSVVMGFKLLVDARLLDTSPLFCPSERWWNARDHWPWLTFSQAWKPYVCSYAQREEFITTDRFSMQNVQPEAAYTADWFTTAIPAIPYANSHQEGWNAGFFDGSASWRSSTPAIWSGITWSSDYTGQAQTWRKFDK